MRRTTMLAPSRIAFGVLAAASLLAAAEAPDDNWPVFRGSAEQAGVARSSVPDDLQVLWTYKAGDSIEGSVAVAGGVVFAPALDEHLVALELATGKQRWKYKGGPFKAPAAARGGRVYAGDLDGNLHCVN